jgi:hypothetical protein
LNTIHRPLAGCSVNLSISESDESLTLGFPDWQVNRITLQLVDAFFGQGATVVFGHNWREDGVMDAVCGFAQQVQSPFPISSDEADATGEPLLKNVLPWPDKPYLPKEELESLNSTLRVEQAGLPPELQELAGRALQEGPSSNLYKYLRARALTVLRYHLNSASSARLCLGGRVAKYQGRYPGIIEEALLALRFDKPLFLAGILGGAVKQLGEAFEGKPMPAGFCGPALSVYQLPPVTEQDPTTAPDRIIDPTAVWDELREAGFQKLGAVNLLSEQENKELLHTQVLDRVIELVLTGLARLKAASTTQEGE